MKKEQLEIILDLHSNFQKSEAPREPSINNHIRAAIIKGKIRLKPVAKILEACKKRLSENTYNFHEVELHRVFEPPNDYVVELQAWKAKSIEHNKRLEAYRKLASPLLIKAKFENSANGGEIYKELIKSAQGCGLSR